jgi:hypothetical protein
MDQRQVGAARLHKLMPPSQRDPVLRRREVSFRSERREDALHLRYRRSVRESMQDRSVSITVADFDLVSALIVGARVLIAGDAHPP